MNKKSLIIGISVTLVWFLGITIFCILKNFGFEQNNLNSLGDFLAGIFAPVAFFWLILGYVQQGKQLDQNTKALEQQERALQLQIDEMRESVKQQTLLTAIQREQYDAMHNSIKPIINLHQFKVLTTADIIEVERGDFKEQLSKGNRLEFYIENTGIGPALNLEIKRTNQDSRRHHKVIKIDSKESKKYDLGLDEKVMIALKDNDFYSLDLYLSCENLYGRKIELGKYIIEISRRVKDETELYYLRSFCVIEIS